MGSFSAALKQNLEDYETTHGPLPVDKKVEPLKVETVKESTSPTPQEVYDDLSITDETIMGFYANGIMMRYTDAEFKFDFLSNFVPRATVNCRIFMSAVQTARMSDTISSTYAAFFKVLNSRSRFSGWSHSIFVDLTPLPWHLTLPTLLWLWQRRLDLAFHARLYWWF